MHQETRQALTAFLLAMAVSVVAVIFIGLLLQLEDGDEPAPVVTETTTVYVPTSQPTKPARPAPTVTVTAKPKPAPTVTVTRTAHPVSRARGSASDEAFLRCVVKRESGGDPTAQNPSSSASGLFQFIDGTWRAYARESGIGAEYSRAKHAPAATQWALARWVVEHKGRYPWHYPPKPC